MPGGNPLTAAQVRPAGITTNTELADLRETGRRVTQLSSSARFGRACWRTGIGHGRSE
jgi:hypothetical protein